MEYKYKSYWRKSGLKGKWGNIFLEHLKKYNPKTFLEIGVFCGVTAINTCNFLKSVHGQKFEYIGVDLFGGVKSTDFDEIEPNFLTNQKFSNPLKNLYYNIILKENLNSIESVNKLLRNYKNNINLIKGDTNSVLKNINLSKIDYAFIDGGHSYKTVLNDLNLLYESLKGKNKILLCDDYGEESIIKEVKDAIDDFVRSNNLNLNIIANRFAEITT